MRNSTDVRHEMTVQRADGARREVVFHMACFRRSDHSVGGIIGSITDITEMKEAMPDAEEWAGKPNKLGLLER